MSSFPNLIEVKHPLLQHKLSSLREAKTTTKEFNELAREVTLLLAYEATKDLPLMHKNIKTPLETFEAPFMKGKKPVDNRITFHRNTIKIFNSLQKLFFLKTEIIVITN